MTHVVDTADYVIGERRAAPTARVADIVTLASQVSDVARRDIMSRHRFPEIIRVRQACYLLAREAGHSYPRIARHMDRDHSSVIYGAKIAVKRCRTDGEFADFVAKLRDRVRCSSPFLIAPVAA